MRFNVKHIFMTASLLCLLQGCIKEDISECNPGVLLTFDYSLNTERANLFEAEVDKVTVFVFDDEGLYYGRYADAGAHLTNTWQMLLPIPPGHYTAVTWGGQLTSYSIGETDADEETFADKLEKGVTKMDHFLLMARQEGAILTEAEDLYHGKTAVTSVYWPEKPSTVNLVKNTNLLKVRIIDDALSEGRDGSGMAYTVTARGANARYKADNSIGAKAKMTAYMPYKTYSAHGEEVAELCLLRLLKDRQLLLTVTGRDGKAIYDHDLMEHLKATGKYNTQEDLDREDEYEVVIRTDRGSVLTVTINGWEAVEVTPGYHNHDGKGDKKMTRTLTLTEI